MYKGVTGVEATDDYKLLLCFDNKEKRVFDASTILSCGRFSELKDLSLFKRVRISFDTIEWDNGLDLDPEYLYRRSKEVQSK
jgi:hypothetical protein